MAPEVIELKGACPASDIWSLGCTVIELFTGHPPYFDQAAITAMFRIVEEEPVLPQDASPELAAFLNRCLRKDPRERATAQELLLDPFITRPTESTVSHKL